jgi:hypothetical protein
LPDLDDIDGLLDQAIQPPARDPLDVLLDVAGNDDPAAIEIDEGDFRALEEEWAVLVRLRERKERLEGLADKASIDYNLQRDRMRRAMEAQGTRQFASAEGRGAGSLKREYRTKVVDDAAFSEWVAERHPELLSVNSQRRDSFVRDEYRDRGVAPTLEDGSPNPDFPPGLQVIEQDTLSVRGTRPVNQEPQ